MHADPELHQWQQQWQSREAIHADLQRAVRRGTRSMRYYRASEIAVTIVFGGGSLAWALVSQTRTAAVLAIAMWAFIAAGWMAATRLRRGAWEPAAATTIAFLDLSILRAERDRTAIVVSAILYVLILIFDLFWLYGFRHESDVRVFFTRWPVLMTGAVTIAAGGWAVWHRRMLQTQLAVFRRLRQQLHEQ